MIDKSFIEKIIELKRPEIIQPVPGDFVTKEFSRIPRNGFSTFYSKTLNSIIDFIKSRVDGIDKKIIVHIKNHESVSANSEVFGEFSERVIFVDADCSDLNNKNGDRKMNNYLPLDEFVIFILTNFVQTKETQDLLKNLNSITDSSVKVIDDDGISQSVTVKAGISLNKEMVMKPIIELQPYRTFPDIEQPKSPFVFRLKKCGDEIKAGIFETYDVLWKIKAMQNIYEKISKELSGIERVIIVR